MNLPSSQGEAKDQGSNKYFDGKTCRRGHICPRYTRNRMCVQCSRILKNEYRGRNIENLREYDRKYAKENAAKRKENAVKWKKENPERCSIHRSKRRASQQNAFPCWLSKEQELEIEKIYALAKWMAEAINTDFHVDHMFPLTSDFMCGLHVPENLIVLSAKDNLCKNNIWWPGQLECQKGRGRSHEWWRDAMQKAGENF